MISIWFKSIICLIGLISVLQLITARNEAQQTEDKFKHLMEKLQQMDQIEYLFHLKICDESTLEGEIAFTEDESNKILECEKLDDDQSWGETEANIKCIGEAFKQMNKQRVLYNIFCNQTRKTLHYDRYTLCINKYYEQHFKKSHYYIKMQTMSEREEKLNHKIKHMKGLLKGKQEATNCYKKSLGYTASTDYEKVHHDYEYKKQIFLNCYALNDEESRNESFSIQTEAQKVTDFIKCYELLDSECFLKFNLTYLDYFNKHKDQNDETTYQKFVISRMSYIYELISKCQTQKYGKLKAIEYYSKQKEVFGKLNECQINVLKLTKLEEEQLTQRQYFYSFDF